jgi:tryptophan synthase alpha chain
MPNRIEQKFNQLRQQKRKAFIAFVTAGDPDLETTAKLVLEFEKSGVDIVELGVPFSDPLADGPTIQASSERALKKGVNLSKIFTLVKKLRQSTALPLALMLYYNPIFHYGEEKFIKDCQHAGVDGIIVPDLPPEEAEDLIRLARKANITTTFFIAPTTTKERMRLIADKTTGFIYYVAVTGVTGARQGMPPLVTEQIKTAKRITKKPICVGFGVSTPEQVKSISKLADGVVVGSAIINQIVKNQGNKALVQNVSNFVRKLSQAR